jgi:putative hemolysin
MIVENLVFEAAVIFLLILANGFFAASEIAMIAIRKSRIDTMIEKGVKRALIIGRLKKDPDRFLATVQIGVTIVSSLASALGGAAAISFVKPSIEASAIPALAPWSDVIAIAVVVIPISYLSLVFGELVPK